MKIIYLHQYFVTPQSSGGTRSYEFARRLLDQGHEVRVITSSAYLPDEYRRLTKITNTLIEGIPVTVIPVPYSNKLSFQKRMLAFVHFALLASFQTVRHRADVIFATSTPLTIAIPAIIGSRWQRKPMVFEVRDLWPEVPIAMGALKNPILRLAAHVLEWLAYHSSRHIIALSPDMAVGVQRRGIPADRVSVIPNGCDIQFFQISPNEGVAVRQKLGLEEAQPLVVYTGTFGYANGLSYLVELAHHMWVIDPSVHFLLVGDGVERDKIVKLAESYQLLNRSVSIWESVPKSRVPAILAAASVAVSTFIPKQELWNNSANKFFDTLAAGRPIAVNHGGWLADLITERGVGIVLDPDNPRQAAYEFAKFLQHQETVANAGMKASRLARERFDRDVLTQQLEDILDSVVEHQ